MIKVVGSAIIENTEGKVLAVRLNKFYNAKIVGGEPKIMEPGKILEAKWIDRSELKNADSIHWLEDQRDTESPI